MVIVKIQDLERVGGTNWARVCQGSEITYLNETGYEVNFIESDGTNYTELASYSCKGWGCPAVAFAYEAGNSKCGVAYAPNNRRHLIRLDDDYPSYGEGLKYATSCENYENAYTVNKPGSKGYVVGCPNGLELYLNSSIASNSPTTSTLIASTPTLSAFAASTPTLSKLAASTPTEPTLVTSESVTESILSKSLMTHTADTDFSSSSSNSLPQTISSSSLTGKFSASDALWPISTPSDESSGEVYASTPISEFTSSTSQEPQQSNEIVDLSKTSAQLSVGAIIGIIFASIAGFSILAVLAGLSGFIFLSLSSQTKAGQEHSYSRTVRSSVA